MKNALKLSTILLMVDPRTTRWIDAPLPMPANLVALSSAIVGGDATSIRMLAAERCK